MWKRADPWGFAAFAYARQKLESQGGKLNCLRFVMPRFSTERSFPESPKCEAFKRRLSYLADINKDELSIVLSVGGKEDEDLTMASLEKRTKHEFVRNKIMPRKDYDESGKLEKDLQAFLIGRGLPKDRRTNERLALFGKDFVNNKNLRVVREFPTGVFKDTVSEDTMILPAEYVDFVTINKRGEIAIIELKFNDYPLEVIAQFLNYILFFYSYITNDDLISLLKTELECEPANADITAYLVSNVFHPRLDEIWPYYFKNEHFKIPNGRHIKIQQVKLGHYMREKIIKSEARDVS